MRLLVTNRNFALLWWAGLLSTMGDWALHIALPVYIFETTGSTLATGLMFAAGTVPRTLFGSVAGIFVDRLDRRRTLVVVNLLLCAGLLPLLLIPASSGLWLVYLVAFTQACLSRFGDPAENALLPTLVQDNLAAANALNALNNNLGRLVGPALGGLLMGGLGLKFVVIFDAATFLAASLLIACMAAPGSTAPARVDKDATEFAAGVAHVWLEWLEGWRIVKGERVVSVLFLYSAVTLVGEGVVAALFIPFVADVLRGDALAVGWLMSAQAVRSIVGGAIVGGGVVVSAVATRFAPARLLGWGSVGVGVLDAIIFNYPVFLPGITLGIVLFAVAGLPVSALQTGLMTLFQTSVDDRFLGRVFGAYGTTAALFNLLGLGAGGFLGDRLGIVLVLNTQAVAYLAGGFLVLRLLRRSVGQIKRD
ncbi:MFS transporter [soil metagenome]